MQFVQKYWHWLLLLSLSLRLLHFGEALDGPHVWRQSDTGQYIRHFYEEGIDLLHPAVSWMGGHGTMILEFPIVEALVAIVYHATRENHCVARLVFLLFFLISAIYLRKILKMFFANGIPELATILYSLAPLSIFYSRAIHIDFSVIAFSHIMFYHLLKGVAGSSRKDLVIGSFWATLALLVKAPYAFCFIVPLLAFVQVKSQWKFVVKQLYLGGIPVLVFVLWRWHVGQVNGAAPNWGFMLGYNNFTDMWYWYFGEWEQRLDWQLWLNLGKRVQQEITGVMGVFFLSLGLIKAWFSNARAISFWWILGMLVYMLVFFNLNVRHNYYQTPLVAPVALLIAIGMAGCIDVFKKRKAWFAVTLILAFGIESYQMSESRYFRQPIIEQAISSVIKSTSEKGDLIVISTDYSPQNYPSQLYDSDRVGWSYPLSLQNPTVLYKLKDEGASSAYLITKTPKLSGEIARIFRNTPGAELIPIAEHGLTVYRIPL